ncbi:MAG: hypothetical protein E7J94_19285 [Clostridium sp.]|nr:hypothetical protein [Clostridium sp.]
MDNYNIDENMRLGEAVIMQAARDYMKALRQLNKHQRDSAAKYTVKECESFFRNRMGKYVVSDIDGEAIIRELRRKVDNHEGIKKSIVRR